MLSWTLVASTLLAALRMWSPSTILTRTCSLKLLRARPGPRPQALPPAPRPNHTLQSPDFWTMSHGLFRSLTPHRPRHSRPPLPLAKQPPLSRQQRLLLCARARLSPVSPPPRPLPLTVLNLDPLLLPPLIALPPRARTASCCHIKDLPGLQPRLATCQPASRAGRACSANSPNACGS